jgi:hypothetical protein
MSQMRLQPISFLPFLNWSLGWLVCYLIIAAKAAINYITKGGLLFVETAPP